MPSTGPSGFGRNEYYASHEEYLDAVAEAMREEYLGDRRRRLHPAGRRPVADRHARRSRPSRSRTRRRSADDARRGPQPRAARHPRRTASATTPATASTTARASTDIAAAKVACRSCCEINAGAYSFEVANPRHSTSGEDLGGRRLPDGKILIPGLLGHANNYVEHPELIAEYICSYAGIVGRENVIAGADCGFSSRAVVRARGAPDRRVAEVQRTWPRAPNWPPNSSGSSATDGACTADRRHVADLRGTARARDSERAAVEVDDAVGAVDGDRSGRSGCASCRPASRRRRGASNSRATIAQWLSTPPTSETTAPAIENSGTHGGSVISHTMISPSSRSPASSSERTTRAVPVYDAGRAGDAVGSGRGLVRRRAALMPSRRTTRASMNGSTSRRAAAAAAACRACRAAITCAARVELAPCAGRPTPRWSPPFGERRRRPRPGTGRTRRRRRR